MNLENKMIHIGTVVNTFGTKGFIKLVFAKDIKLVGDINLIKVIFYKNHNSSLIPLRVEKIEFKGLTLLIKFLDLNSINDVVKFKNLELYINDEFKILEKEIDWLQFEVTFNNQKGEITDFMNNGAQNLIKIKLVSEQKAFWVPMVDVYVKELILENKTIVLQNVEGLK
ncbi:16S rRNA processing protein RimM [Williamsoniiplasma somnilux]|uniref:16S rRNA processing protein RimM n=1 Tax=Williamsoniiplasma somnilux TaxID=215578 RepID=A0A2K8NYG0_9MOLU|nr:hypothetical protein [Williamsoniiplasma somnilux]ATZ18827.1 16S rRNA processing protein RimM [Williamsoniiplasma somnilux]